MKIESISVAGKHYHNEDRLFYKEFSSESTVAVVADGMGGLSLGNVAAELVVNAVGDYIIGHIGEQPAEKLLADALKVADHAVAVKSAELHSKMGAALVVVLIDKGRMHFTWLGNVRIYFADATQMELLTSDHVTDVGYGNTRLTRCIKGRGLREDVPCQVRKTAPGDVILLCTDGYYKQIKIEDSCSGNIPVIADFEDDATIVRISL